MIRSLSLCAASVLLFAACGGSGSDSTTGGGGSTQLAYAKGFGVTNLETKAKPDADTIYRIASVTKSFTALAVLGA